MELHSPPKLLHLLLLLAFLQISVSEVIFEERFDGNATNLAYAFVYIFSTVMGSFYCWLVVFTVNLSKFTLSI